MENSDCTENINLCLDSFFANDKPAEEYDPNDSLIQDLFGTLTFDSKDQAGDANQSEDVVKEQTNGLDTKSESGSSEIEAEITPSKPILSQDRIVKTKIEQLKQQYSFYREENVAVKNENIVLKSKIDELELQISDIKQENAELNDEVIELQEKLYKNSEELSSCEKEYSSKLSDWLQLKMECETLKRNFQVLEEEKISLQNRLEQKEAELKQFKDLVQKQITDEEEILAVKKELAEANKLLKKAEKTNQHNIEQLASKDERLRTVRINLRKTTNSYKKIMTVLMEFAEMLNQRNLLPPQKKKLLKKLAENIQVGNFDFEEENGDSDEKSVIGRNHLDSYSCTDLSLFDESDKIKKEDISEGEMFNYSFKNKLNAANHLMSSPCEAPVNLNGSVHKSHFPKSIFSPVSCKIENTSSNENTMNEIDLKHETSLNSKDFSHISSKLQSLYSYSLQNSDDFINKIPGIKIFKEEERPISPIPPFPKSIPLNGSSEAQANGSDENIPIAKEFSDIQNVFSPVKPSSDCQKRSFLSQKSCLETDLTRNLENKIKPDEDTFITEFSNVQRDILLAEQSSDSQNSSLLPQKSSCSEMDLTEDLESNKNKNDFSEVFECSKSDLAEDFENNKNKSDLTEDFERNKSKCDLKEDFESNKRSDKDTLTIKEFNNEQTNISPAEPLSVNPRNSLDLMKHNENKNESKKDTLIVEEFKNVQKNISLSDSSAVPKNSHDLTKNFENKIESEEDTLMEKESEEDTLMEKESEEDTLMEKKSEEDTPMEKEFSNMQKDILQAKPSSIETSYSENSTLPQKSSSEINCSDDFENSKTEEKVSDLEELLPSNFYYVGSSYSEDDNKHNIVHFGKGVLNCLVNTEKKLVVCTLDIPKQTESKSIQNRSGIVANKERISSVLDLYYATEKHLTAIGRQLPNSDSSQQFKSHFHVVFESKNDIISTACDPKSFTKSTNSFENIQKDESFVTSKFEQELSQACDNNHLDSSNSFLVSFEKSPVQVYKIQNTDSKSQENKSFPMPIIVNTMGNYNSTDEIYNHIHTVQNNTSKLEFVGHKTPEKESTTMNQNNFSNVISPSQNKSQNIETSQNLGNVIESNHESDFSVTDNMFNDEKVNPVITSVSSLQSVSALKKNFFCANTKFVDNQSLDNHQELQSKKKIKRQQNFSIVNPSPSKSETTSAIELSTDSNISASKKQKCFNNSPFKNEVDGTAHIRPKDSPKSVAISPSKPNQPSQNGMLEMSMTNMQLQKNLVEKPDVLVNKTSEVFGEDYDNSTFLQSNKVQSKKLPKNVSKVLRNPKDQDIKQKNIVNGWSIAKANELLGVSKKKKNRKKRKSKLNQLSNSVPLASNKTVHKLKNITSKKNLEHKECNLLNGNGNANKQKPENSDVKTKVNTNVKEVKSKIGNSIESLNIKLDSHVNTIESTKVISGLNENDLNATDKKNENKILASSESLTSTSANICKKGDSKDNHVMYYDSEKQSNRSPKSTVDNNIPNLNLNTSSNNLSSVQKSIVLPVSDLTTSEHSVEPPIINTVPLKDEDTVEYSPAIDISDSNVNTAVIHSSENEIIKSKNSVKFHKDENTESKAVIENGIVNECINNSIVNKSHYDRSVDLQIQYPQTKMRHNSFQSNISEDENPLIIVEELEEKSNSDSEIMSENCFNNSEVELAESTEVKNNTSVKNKTKKRKKSKSPGRKKKKKTVSTNEEPVPVLPPIEAVLEEIKKIKIEDIKTNHSHSKLLVHSLINVLINPSNSPNTTTVLFHIFSHLSSSKLNPLLSFSIRKDDSVFLPPSEQCIVEALIKVDRKKKNHLEGLLKSAIITLYYLVLEKKNISKTGLAAFCRIFTQLCKYLKIRSKPMTLCCDLIKRNHQFAPFLIANIIGVWKDLFAVKEDSKDYELLLQSSIAYGVQKKPPTLTSNDWKQCKALFIEFIVAPAVPYPTETAKVAMDSLNNILNEMPTENDFAFIEPLVIFSALEGKCWAWENVVKPFVLPSCLKYAHVTENERAFSLLLELYAEIGMHVPDDSVGARGALLKFFNMKEAFAYVKPNSARFLIKLTLFKQITLDPALLEWIAENEQNLKGTSVEFSLKRQLIADEPSFTENDIISES